jgi:hypothetical protein
MRSAFALKRYGEINFRLNRERKFSGLRGSNPSSWLGKPEHYHYAKPASVDVLSYHRGDARCPEQQHVTSHTCHRALARERGVSMKLGSRPLIVAFVGRTHFLEYRIYTDEGHVIHKKAHVIDFWNRRLEFLQEGLEPTR